MVYVDSCLQDSPPFGEVTLSPVLLLLVFFVIVNTLLLESKTLSLVIDVILIL